MATRTAKGVGPVLKLVERYLQELKGRGYRVRSAVIFGSRARGDHLKSSDIDLLLVVEGVEAGFMERVQALIGLWEGRVGLEVFPYTPKEVLELFKRGSITVYDALDEGVTVYDDGFLEGLRQAFRQALGDGVLGRSSRGWWRIPNPNLVERYLDRALPSYRRKG